MKKYTFKFDDNNTRNINTTPSTNYSAIIDDIIRTNIKKANPYLFGEYTYSKSTPIIIDTPTKSRTIDIDITIPAKKTPSIDYIDMIKYPNLAKAIDFLKIYDFKDDDYDFKTDDGTPIKLFADEIQIGFDLIPLTSFTKKIYDSLSERSKKIIIDIYIKLNKD